MLNLAKSYSSLGRLDESLKLDKETFARLTVPDDSLRDLVHTKELAMNCIVLQPEKGEYSTTFGLSEYRTGQWQASVDSRQKALSFGGQARFHGNGFILAMAYWQLGDKEQSRKLYEDADGQLKSQKYPPNDAQRFRAEAAQLLGIKVTD